MRAIDFETGTQIGDWTVISLCASKTGRRYVCRCVCGTERSVAAASLRGGVSMGCGCARTRKLADRATKHGKSDSPTYRLWASIKHRLATQKAYEGVRMAEEWQNDVTAFESFLLSLGPKPTPEHTLDRIDPSGNYEPGNLRWASKSEQSQNRRSFGGWKVATVNRDHGETDSAEHKLWRSIKHRLRANEAYASVRMDPTWESDFTAFAAHIRALGPKPTPSHSLDRIDPYGNYEPGNVRWADKTTQSENRRNNRARTVAGHGEGKVPVSVGQVFGRATVVALSTASKFKQNWYMADIVCECGGKKTVYAHQLASGRTTSCGCVSLENLKRGPLALEKPIEFNGESLTLTQWAAKLGCSKNVLWMRINKLKWPLERALTAPTSEHVLHLEANGERLPIGAWAERLGVPTRLIWHRVQNLGWTDERAVTTPARQWKKRGALSPADAADDPGSASFPSGATAGTSSEDH